MAATEHPLRPAGPFTARLRRLAVRRTRGGRRPRGTWQPGPALARRLAVLMASVLGAAGAGAVALGEDRGEAIYHYYDGGGVEASGPALLVRKGITDKLALNGSYYVDAVSNASIDVVTQASAFRETRTAYDVGAEYVHRDARISFGVSRSSEPDYTADAWSADVSQEVFGGMTTVSVGFTRGNDKVGEKGVGFFDTARHWQYRLGVTQILSPRWLASANFEIVSDDGYLGSPYRNARVFGALVPERNPRTRSSRALKFRSIHAVGEQGALRAEYRYFWDNWDITAHTLEGGYARYLGDRWVLDGSLRLHTQGSALFYSDDATEQTRYVSRNRQLSEFRSIGLALKATWTARGDFAERYGLKLTGGYEYKQFRYGDFTDLRSGADYGFNAHVLQLTVTSTF